MSLQSTTYWSINEICGSQSRALFELFIVVLQVPEKFDSWY